MEEKDDELIQNEDVQKNEEQTQMEENTDKMTDETDDTDKKNGIFSRKKIRITIR